jgi:predicted metal-dependent hydrolase
MERDPVNSVVASNFQRSYRARAKNERDYLALLSSVKSYMASLTEGMKMPALPTDAEFEQRRLEQIRRVADL